LVIHNLNPFGFKNLRRVNENNIDLNRNFALDSDLFKRSNIGYENLKFILEPKRPVRFPYLKCVINALILGLGFIFKKFTMRDLIQAVATGQYVSPKGIQFGGQEVQEQVFNYKKLITKFGSQHRRIVSVDLHTGLGSANQLHMLTSAKTHFSNSQFLRQMLRQDLDGDHYDYVSSQDPGFYETFGDLNTFVHGQFSSEQEVLALTAEFGTLGVGMLDNLKLLNALILENQGHHFGYASERLRKKVKENFKNIFFPTDVQWRELSLAKGQYLFDKIIQRLQETHTGQ
jgi:hypothetical protein